MGPPSGCSRYSIGVIVGVKASATLQVTRDGAPFSNEIIMEKSDGEGGVLVVYCSFWDALLGIRRT